MQGRCEDAIPILERLTAEYPRIAAANEMLAGCYIKEGRAQDAASLLERCLEEEPGQFAYVRDLGRAYIDLGRQRGSRRRLAAACSRATRSTASMYGHVAKMEQEAGLYDEAIETLRAGTRFKENAEYYCARDRSVSSGSSAGRRTRSGTRSSSSGRGRARSKARYGASPRSSGNRRSASASSLFSTR